SGKLIRQSPAFHDNWRHVSGDSRMPGSSSTETSNSTAVRLIRLGPEVVDCPGFQVVDFYFMFLATVRPFRKLVQIISIQPIRHPRARGSACVPDDSNGVLVGRLHHG